jgi:hypothetical protein
MNPLKMLRLFNATTPSEITPLVRDFCASFTHSDPEYVPVMPEGKPACCYPNVKAKVETEGGEIIYGRTIWLAEGLIEAEWHTVWKNGDKLVDITAKPDGEKRILFVRTDEVWDGVTVWPNIRKVLVNNPDLLRLLAIQEEIERNTSRTKDGQIRYDLGSALGKLISKNQPRPRSQTQPLSRSQTQPPPPKYRAGRNEPCPCRSGLKFKRCCGRPHLPTG